jgi:mannose-binding lectin 2
MAKALTLVGAAITATLCSASLMDTHSFEPPFNHIDPSGARSVSKDWKIGGVASVNTNFMRLTPDRQSKKGSVWSRKPLGVTTFSSVFTFRISGQGKKFFGDGMALWFMQQPYYVEGEFHGSIERFTGFGIIFDTFKNTETLAFHRDISIVYNDGDKTQAFMIEKKQGCDANIRYHEERGDFSVSSSSRAKVVVMDGTSVSVLIDAKNDGNFAQCASMELPLAKDWSQNAYVGVSASTGQLADNHDVLSLVTYSDIGAHEHALAVKAATPAFARGYGMSEERFERLEDTVATLLDKLEFLEHHLEHELAAVDDHTKVTVEKLKARESTSEGRLDDLEKKIKESLGKDVTSKILSMSASIDQKVAEKIATVEAQVGASIKGAVSGVGGWKLPFFVLFAMMAASVFGLYQWYQKLKKTHML